MLERAALRVIFSPNTVCPGLLYPCQVGFAEGFSLFSSRRRFLRETLKMSNAEDLNRLTACSLVLLGHIFYVLGNHRVSARGWAKGPSWCLGRHPVNTFILCLFLDDLVSVTSQPPISMRLGKSRSALAHKPGGAGEGWGCWGALSP